MQLCSKTTVINHFYGIYFKVQHFLLFYFVIMLSINDTHIWKINHFYLVSAVAVFFLLDKLRGFGHVMHKTPRVCSEFVAVHFWAFHLGMAPLLCCGTCQPSHAKPPGGVKDGRPTSDTLSLLSTFQFFLIFYPNELFSALKCFQVKTNLRIYCLESSVLLRSFS